METYDPRWHGEFDPLRAYKLRGAQGFSPKRLYGQVGVSLAGTTGGTFLSFQEGKDDQLIQFARDGELPEVRESLANGADVHARKDAAMRLAFAKGHIETGAELVGKHRADIDVLCGHVLKEAFVAGDFPRVRMLILNLGANPVNICERAVIRAFKNGGEEMAIFVARQKELARIRQSGKPAPSPS
jgi:hypothetical protein